jgi:hypothetical protein
MNFGRSLGVILFMAFCFTGPISVSQNMGIETDTIKKTDTTSTGIKPNQSQLGMDEGIKCTRAELLDKEFVAVGKSKYGEIIRITYQDLERGSREIIFQKKLAENDEVKFYMPFDLIKDAKTAVLIVMKGDGMFFKKIDITD